MSHKIIVCRGIPASGKTTWSTQWVKEDSSKRVRFNRDSIRNMLGDYWVPSREPLVDDIYFSFLQGAMSRGYEIVLDNMNLNEKSNKELEKEVQEFNEWVKLSSEDNQYSIEYKDFFDVSLEECIDRDSKRESPIGENVIRGIYERYKDILKK